MPRLAIALALLSAASSFAEGPRIKPGEHWYRLTDDKGKTEGFMRLAVQPGHADSFCAQWELRVAYPGGSYEEDRTMSLLEGSRLAAASIRVTGGPQYLLTREGKNLTVSAKKTEAESPVDTTFEGPDDAGASLTFLIAATMPREAGAKLTRTNIKFDGTPAPGGTTTITCAGPEEIDVEGQKVVATKYTIDNTDRPATAVWVGPDGLVLRYDWGGGSTMWWSSKPTRDLFKVQPPAVTQVNPDDKTTLIVQGVFPGFTPEEAFDHFTKSDLLAKWWPPKAEIEEKVGGKYVLEWPGQWKLNGKVLAWERGAKFGFSWKWEHDKTDTAPLEVQISFVAVEGGTEMRIEHGPFPADDADAQKVRAELFEGWKYFCARLKDLKS